MLNWTATPLKVSRSQQDGDVAVAAKGREREGRVVARRQKGFSVNASFRARAVQTLLCAEGVARGGWKEESSASESCESLFLGMAMSWEKRVGCELVGYKNVMVEKHGMEWVGFD